MTRGRIPFLILLAAWPLFLFVQQGDDFDEAEHCHVAWLMGRMHQRPLHDFFQHHQPLLWDLLKVYYVVGGDGPEVLYFGRALTAGCALLYTLGAFLLARRWARGQDGAAPPGWLGAVLGVAPVLLYSLAFRQSVVIRPETVGLPPFALALACWARPGAPRRWAGIGRGLLTGALLGVAVYASPRFAPLCGGLILLPWDRGRLFCREIVPLLAAAVGAAATLAGCQLTATGSLTDFYFNLEFSALTYKVGATETRIIPHLLVVAAELLLAAAWVYWRLDGPGRRRFLVQGAYLLLATAAALSSAWPHLYPQNFLAPVAWLGAMFACAAGRTEAARAPEQVRAEPRLALVIVGVALLLATRDFLAWDSIVARVEQKHAVLALLRPGERVLLSATFHPICAPDATYYVNPIVDDDDHWGRAVALARQRHWDLPDCDYLRDVLDGRPALVDDTLIRALPEADRARFREVLAHEYTQVNLYPSAHHCYRRGGLAHAPVD